MTKDAIWIEQSGKTIFLSGGGGGGGIAMPGGIATPVDTVSKNNPTGSNTIAVGNKEGQFLKFLPFKCLVSMNA